ncbi:MAG: polysaccharide biosynthesis protein-like protein [Rhodospirillales bacterium]|nr:polysaccharide biosynthesis protein-like protein [Rhodospirillales bacterium]
MLRTLIRATQWLWYGTIDQIQWLRGLLRLRPHYIEQQWPGIQDGAIEGKVCVFAHFDRKGIIHEYVLFYLRSLRMAGFKIIFVSNAATLDPAGLAEVRDLAHLVLRRSNVGYDFGGYKDAISMIPDAAKLDFLLLANDSVYGPFSPIADMLAGIDPARAQFWGLTDSWEGAYHLQSYFLLFGREALGHEAFAKFWRRVRYINSKSYVIRRYELGLSRQLMKGGLRGLALFSARDASRIVIEEVGAGALRNPALDGVSKTYLKRMHGAVERGGTLNISHFFWDRLILKMGCPFLKRELLEKNPVAVPYVSRWQEVIGGVSDYDTDLIMRHLEVTLRDRAT